MKQREILFKQLENMPFFNKDAILQLGKQYKLKKSTIDSYISRSLKHKDIFSLKNGMYVSASFYNKNKNDISYTMYLANVIRTPSYVSSWTALQYYGLATEAIHTIISITSKVTRTYKTKVGSFFYNNIKKEFFSDFSLVRGKFDFFLASPAKALFDLFYFRTRQFRGIKFEDISILIKELRIDFDEMDKKEQKRFYAMIKKYLNHE